MTFNRRFLVAMALLAVTACASSSKDPAAKSDRSDATSPHEPARITVMTWNVCYGGSGGGGIPEMGKMFKSAQDSDFPQRAQRIVRIIGQQQPDVVCLQEVARWTRKSILGGGEDTIDFLAILQERLQSRGLHYDVAGSLETIDFEAPGLVQSRPCKVKWQERIVMLTRHGGDLQVSNVHQQHYKKLFSIPIPALDDLTFNRGFIAADIASHGKKARCVCTHLEAISESVRDAQARELVEGLGGAGQPVLVMGDMNAEPASAAYEQFTRAGFADACTTGHDAGDAGATCCQASDLRNSASSLSRRIDHVFVRGALKPMTSLRVGNEPADRTQGGLWPSDHAGVVVKIRWAD